MSLEQEFGEFWKAYPRRIARLNAFKAYVKARKVASAEQILDGVRRYCAHLPEDTQFICHASTFLNQGRWDDEYDEPARKKAECPHSPRCNSPVWCEVVKARQAGAV